MLIFFVNKDFKIVSLNVWSEFLTDYGPFFFVKTQYFGCCLANSSCLAEISVSCLATVAEFI